MPRSPKSLGPFPSYSRCSGRFFATDGRTSGWTALRERPPPSPHTAASNRTEIAWLALAVPELRAGEHRRGTLSFSRRNDAQQTRAKRPSMRASCRSDGWSTRAGVVFLYIYRWRVWYTAGRARAQRALAIADAAREPPGRSRWFRYRWKALVDGRTLLCTSRRFEPARAVYCPGKTR